MTDKTGDNDRKMDLLMRLLNSFSSLEVALLKEAKFQGLLAIAKEMGIDTNVKFITRATEQDKNEPCFGDLLLVAHALSRATPLDEGFDALLASFRKMWSTSMVALEFPVKDIELVMDQGQCTRQIAIDALRKNKGDIVSAIMDLTEQQSPCPKVCPPNSGKIDNYLILPLNVAEMSLPFSMLIVGPQRSGKTATALKLISDLGDAFSDVHVFWRATESSYHAFSGLRALKSLYDCRWCHPDRTLTRIQELCSSIEKQSSLPPSTAVPGRYCVVLDDFEITEDIMRCIYDLRSLGVTVIATTKQYVCDGRFNYSTKYVAVLGKYISKSLDNFNASRFATRWEFENVLLAATNGDVGKSLVIDNHGRALYCLEADPLKPALVKM